MIGLSYSLLLFLLIFIFLTDLYKNFIYEIFVTCYKHFFFKLLLVFQSYCNFAIKWDTILLLYLHFGFDTVLRNIYLVGRLKYSSPLSTAFHAPIFFFFFLHLKFFFFLHLAPRSRWDFGIKRVEILLYDNQLYQ